MTTELDTLRKQLAESKATITVLREALDKAARALESTADYVAYVAGHETGTSQGIRTDAREARQALAATEPPPVPTSLSEIPPGKLKRNSCHMYVPTVCPFPPQAIGKQEVISDVEFPDPMLLKQYDREPEPDSGHWQLLADYRMIMRLPGDDSLWTITAPRGMMTDQASIPQRFWDWEGLAPFGPHSGPSIIHDMLFMCWNIWPLSGEFASDNDTELRQRFNFANRVFWTGLVVKGVEVRKRMYHSVDLFGWEVFKDNPEPFDQAMNRWLGWLDD